MIDISNLAFGTPLKMRNGHKAIYLSAGRYGSVNDPLNPPFTIVYIAIDHDKKYPDGGTHHWHEVLQYDQNGHSNRFDTGTEYPEDIVDLWKEE